ncbi:MAG: methyltransferase domain-containing protein [Gammaproteobacteria bacterium]
MLRERSQEKELLDLGADHYTTQEYEHCMKMLFRVNKLFGYFYSTVKILKHFPQKSTLLDIGCGGGLFLLNLSQYFPGVQFKGIDISPEAINLANKELRVWENKRSTHNVSFHLQTLPSIELTENSVDIILTTLVCHHLNNEDLIEFLKSTLKASRQIVIIHDLHRHTIAQWLFRLVSPPLFNNRLISHDGLISIRRGFVRSEWKALLEKAGINNYELKWCFPFRWKLILCKNGDYLKGI